MGPDRCVAIQTVSRVNKACQVKMRVVGLLQPKSERLPLRGLQKLWW